MIVYDLKCRNNHTFEGWFEDSKAFEKQRKAALIACPVCNETDVRRMPSTFAIKGAPRTAPTAKPSEGPQPDPQALAQAVVQYVQDNFDNVGADFAKEALKMHYGVSKPRNIRGVSTQQEEKTLRQEGIEFFKFPMPVTDSSSSPDSDSSDSDA